MKNIFVLGLLATAASFSILIPCAGAGTSVSPCPEQISEPSIVLTNVGAGWRAFIASPLYLHSVAAADGPPERLGQLMGKQARTGRNEWADNYDLRGPFPDGKWLQCSYGMLNEIVLSKRLDDSITSCTIKGRKGDKAGQNVFSVECR